VPLLCGRQRYGHRDQTRHTSKMVQ